MDRAVDLCLERSAVAEDDEEDEEDEGDDGEEELAIRLVPGHVSGTGLVG